MRWKLSPDLCPQVQTWLDGPWNCPTHPRPCLAVKVHSFTRPFIPLIYSHTRPPSNHPPADLFIIYIFMYPSTPLFIHFFTHVYTHSFVIHSFTTSYICPLIDSFAHPSIHHPSVTRSFIHAFAHSLIHLTTITYWMSDVPGAVWSTGNLAMNKSDKNPCHHGADICVCV